MATKMTKIETVSEEPKKSVVKKYNNTDTIPCRSICNGRLFIDGARSKIFYQWADYGDIVDVEYQDLLFMIRSNDANIMLPRIIIEDEEFVSQNKNLEKLYESLYSMQDFREILSLSPSQMRDAILSLPKGAQNAIKGVASTMIDNGTLDSVAKIKIIDEIFGTNLLLTLAQR